MLQKLQKHRTNVLVCVIMVKHRENERGKVIMKLFEGQVSEFVELLKENGYDSVLEIKQLLEEVENIKKTPTPG
jgi:hypothetical protein